MSRVAKSVERRAWLALAVAAAIGGGAIVATPTSAALPAGRAYELVSPPSKNGGDVLANSARTRVATDGGAVSFSSLAAFGDVLGTGVATDYVAVRSTSAAPGTNGWSTHAITPPQGSLTLTAASRGLDPLYEGAFSPDLTRGVFRAWSPLFGAPNVSKIENLYLRTDLRTPGAGSYQLLSDAVAPVDFANPFFDSFQPRLAGASADFGNVIFESRYHLTADAPPGFAAKLFEWDHGTVRLAGVLPDGSPAPSSTAGAGAFARTYTPHTISANGRRIFFTDPTTGDLYMRQTDPATQARSTVQLNASERTDCAGDPTCGGDNTPDPSPDPSGPQPATYWDASVDGSRVFFTTSEALTDDAPLNGDNKLYMYDTTRPADDPHNLTLVSVDSQPDDGADVQGVIGSSVDGHYVYFVAIGQLVSGLPSPSSIGPLYGVYAWHDGSVAYVGGIYIQNSQDDASQDFQDDPDQSQVTPDGKHLLFASTTGVGLTGYDHGTCGSILPGSGCREVYVYSAVDGHLSCASCNPTGAPATSDASMQARAHGGGSSTTPAINRAISDDGQHVFFTTGEALVPADTNGKLDAYEYNVQTGKVALLSTGKDPFDSYFMTASASGNDAFILTRQRLVGWDVDNAYDLYDVRVGGGFPEPRPVPPACDGDACHGTLNGPPESVTPGSVSVSHAVTRSAAVKPKSKPVRCRRGFVRKRVGRKVRCVRRAHKVAKRATVGRNAR